jgi:hypothetical protein
MKQTILLIFLFTINLLGCCQKKESLKIELNTIVKNKNTILKISLTNCSSKGLFFPAFNVYDILIFFDSNGVNISDSASYLSTRVSGSTKFIDKNYKRNSDYISDIECFFDYDSCVNNKIEVNRVLMNLIDLEYSEISREKEIQVLEDSLFYREFLVYKYYPLMIIPSGKTINSYINLYDIIKTFKKIKVVAKIDYSGPMRSTSSDLFDINDSLKFSNYYIDEIDSYVRFQDIVVSDTIKISN